MMLSSLRCTARLGRAHALPQRTRLACAPPMAMASRSKAALRPAPLPPRLKPDAVRDKKGMLSAYRTRRTVVTGFLEQPHKPFGTKTGKGRGSTIKSTLPKQS